MGSGFTRQSMYSDSSEQNLSGSSKGASYFQNFQIDCRATLKVNIYRWGHAY